VWQWRNQFQDYKTKRPRSCENNEMSP
jgi:hypothetical protein